MEVEKKHSKLLKSEFVENIYLLAFILYSRLLFVKISNIKTPVLGHTIPGLQAPDKNWSRYALIIRNSGNDGDSGDSLENKLHSHGWTGT